jgi:hypothetical protein
MPPILIVLIAGGIFAYLMSRAPKGATPMAGSTQGSALRRSPDTVRIAPVTYSAAFPQTLTKSEQIQFLKALLTYRIIDQMGEVTPALPMGVTVPKDGGSDAATLLPAASSDGVAALPIVAAANRLGHIILATTPLDGGKRGLISLGPKVDYKPFVAPGSNWFLFLLPGAIERLADEAKITLPAPFGRGEILDASFVQEAPSYVAPTSTPAYAMMKVEPAPAPKTEDDVAQIEIKATTAADDLSGAEFKNEAQVWARAKGASTDEEKAAVIPDLVADSAVLKAKGYDLASSQFLTQATTYGYVTTPKA